MTPTTDELRTLAERLEGAVTDWNGERMVDGEPPRETLYCRDLRETAAALRQWIAEREQNAGIANFIASQEPLDAEMAAILENNIEGLYEK